MGMIHTQPRRWAAQQKRNGAAPATEEGVTPDEARAAIYVMLQQTGVVLTRINEYDPQANKYHCSGFRVSDPTVALDVVVGGTEVAIVVRNVRRVMCTPKLTRKSERKAGG